MSIQSRGYRLLQHLYRGVLPGNGRLAVVPYGEGTFPPAQQC